MSDSSMAETVNAFRNLRFENNGAGENSGRPVTVGSSSFSLTATSAPFLPSAHLLRRVPPAVSAAHPPLGFPPRQTFAGASHDRPAVGRGCNLETFRFLLLRTMTCSEGYKEFTTAVERCDEAKLRLLASVVTSDRAFFFKLAHNQHGSTCLRKLLGRCRDVDDMLLSAVVDLFVPIMTDRYGHYVVTKTLDAVERQKKMVLYHLTETHALELARDETGCVALNEVITEVRDPYRERILKLVADNALWLSQDPSGNFVVQRVLNLYEPLCTERIAFVLYGHYVGLSSQRLGSYIVEKVLESRWMTLVVDELLKSGSDQLQRLARNKFGNYVLQTALKATSKHHSELCERLLLNLKPFFGSLRHGYGRNVIATIDRLTVGEDDQTR